MAVLSFGNFPVDMTDPDFFVGTLPAGEPELLDFNSISITGIFPDGSTIIFTGQFDFSSVSNFLNNSFISGIILNDENDDLLFSITGLPRLTFAQAAALSGDEIEALLLGQTFTVNGGSFDDILTGSGYRNVLNGNDGNDLLLDDLGNDDLNGGPGNDELYGGPGNDILDGGPDADLMVGGLGNDVYVVDDLADIILELNGAGMDTVRISLNITLPENLENIVLTGEDDLFAIGNNHNNRITGNPGANLIDGGAGNDMMAGGAGDDFYILDSTGDVVSESVNAGIDTVFILSRPVTSAYILPANVEAAFIAPGAGAVGVTGNSIDNFLFGNGGANRLIGGAGNDDLIGMRGNDILMGGAGNDLLDGGRGDDFVAGGAGNDLYLFYPGDVIVELAGEGIDEIISPSNFDLNLNGNFENLTLTSFALKGVGNALNNVITGNTRINLLEGGAGNDTLNGGEGSDILTGGTGADVFLFDTMLTGNVDLITDFNSIDLLRLDQTIFDSLTAGTLAASNFVTGNSAIGSDDFIIYDATSGNLYYDTDGSGAGAQIQFAVLSGAPALTAADITVIS